MKIELRRGPFICVLILALHAGLLAFSASRQSPTLDEPGHLVAGIYSWRVGRFDLYCVNPPLTRLVAALPSLWLHPETNWSHYEDLPGGRPEFQIGVDFVAANGKGGMPFFVYGRWALIPFSLIGAVVCFFWARDCFGTPAGLVALLLWCFSPTVLGHGSLLTPDVTSAALGVAACYMFWRWLCKPTWSQTLVVGVVLGLSLLSKMTLIVLLLVWPITWLIYCCSAESGTRLRILRQEGAMFMTQLITALFILNAGYGFEGSLTKLDRLKFVSESFRLSEKTTDKNGLAEGEYGNRFQDSWLGKIPVPLPSNYVQGIDVQRRDFEQSPRPSYLRGRFQARGWWYYYLYAMAVKLPIGTLSLLAAACLTAIVGSCQCAIRRDRETESRRCDWRDQVALLLPALTLLILVSSQTGFSHHMRYALPVFPFMFIWASQVAAAAMRLRMMWAVLLALAWNVTSSMSIYPHSLSYFNELAGGPTRGHAHLIDSNIDWGQDLLYLSRWLETQPDTNSLKLVYYGYVDPSVRGISYGLPPRQSQIGSDGQVEVVLEPGTYAVSVNYLRGFWFYYLPAGDGQAVAPEGFDFAYFQQLAPTASAGYSINIYRLTERRTLHAVETP